MNLNNRNIVGAILLVAGIVDSIIQINKGIQTWYEIVIPLALVFFSLLAFDFITIKAIKETFDAATKKDKANGSQQ